MARFSPLSRIFHAARTDAMAKSNNPFKDLNIVRGAMEEVVRAQGGEDYAYEKAGSCFHMSFRLNGAAHKMAVYENKDGTTTLSRSAMDAAVFEKVAEAIRKGCGLGEGGRFDVTIPRFPGESLGDLLEFLAEEKVQTEHDVVEHNYRMVRLRSPQGDKLTIKLFDNGTLHMQGRRAMLATMALDFLASVLNYERAVAAQLDTFKVDIRLKDIYDEIEARLPAAHRRVNDIVRTQLTTALGLSKVNIELPDYAPVAFPALKGLEGFLKAELKQAGLEPAHGATFAEYFEQKTDGVGHRMREPQGSHVGELRASMLAVCYTVYSDERHGIAHVGLDAAHTRTIPDLMTARSIVTKVFRSIEGFCSKLPA